METINETGKHIAAVWADDPGVRFVSVIGKNGVWRDIPHNSNEDALRTIEAANKREDEVFFTVHLYEPGSKDRKGTNAKSCRALFLDIDCGKGKQYPDQETALREAVKSTKEADLPDPVFVSSGLGLHLYWFLDQALGSDEWEIAAGQLRSILAAQGLKFDTGVKDRSRVLRVPGSMHRKNPEDPKLCRVLSDEITLHDPAEIKAILDKHAPAIPSENASKINDPFTAGLETASDAKQLREIVDLCLPFLSVERCDNHDGWLNTGILLCNVLGDDGLPLWEDWSKKSDEFEAGECAKRWDTFSDDRPDGERLKIGSLVQWAKEDGGERFQKEWERYKAEKQVERLAANGYALTDTGNGQRLIDLHGDKIRFDPTRKLWFVYNGRQWVENAWADVMELAKDVAKVMRLEAATFDDPKAFKTLAEHAAKAENVSKYEAMVKAASTDQRIRISISDFDKHPHLLNVANGVIDTMTGELLLHDSSLMMAHCLGVAYDPFAKDDRFDKFLNRTFGGDRDLIGFVQRALGYSLTGETSEDAFFICYGEGANGKSSLLEAFRNLMGELATPLRTEALTRHKTTVNTSHNADIAALFGKRYALASESGEGRQLDMELIKRLSSGDTISASKKYGQPFGFVNLATLFYMANHKPEIRETDYGTKRRIRYIPFLNQVPKNEQDDTREYIKFDPRAQQAMLAWAVRGAVEFYRNGLGTCSAVEDATEQYLNEQDVVARYVGECCDTGTGPDYTVSPMELNEDLRIFCQGYGIEPLKDREVPAEMKRLGFKQDKVKGHRAWLGIRKKSIADYFVAGLKN